MMKMKLLENQHVKAFIGLVSIVTSPVWICLILVFNVLPYHLTKAGDSMIRTIKGEA